MHLVYLLWGTFILGGAFMGVNAVRALNQNGFDIGVLLNAVLYFGIALYGIPKLYKFMFKRG